MSEAATQGKQTHGFQTEVKQLLQLMIHSLYSNKEIFLRELISNAADASDKLRFAALSNNALYENDGELKIRVSFDEEKNTVTIEDNGIGMNADDATEHLGTIAKSGTADFFKNLTGDQAKDSQLIGQFGVGFYSAFIVAKKVVVRSRKAGDDVSQGVEWTSEGEGDYTIEQIEKSTRGTEITLFLSDEEKEFASDFKLRSIIKKYSDHIATPVEMWKEGTPESEGEDGEKIEAVEGEWEVINKADALWTRDKSELEDAEYQEFYKHISHDFEDPLTWAHNKVEGKSEYTSLLYIPKKAPFDLWNRDKQRGLKLYVQRVFIMDDAEQFMPTYLRFVKGLVDSNDLPLNVSREILQDNKVTQTLRKGCTTRVLKMLDRMGKNDKENYQMFWDEFGQVLKEGPAEDMGNKEAIAKLLRFASTHNEDGTQSVSFPEYLERAKEGQDKIYYLVADTYEAAANNPALEIFRKKGIEVVLMYDRIDEWLMSHLTEFDGKQLVSVTRGDLDLGDLEDEEAKKAQEDADKEFATSIERFQGVISDRVKEVKVSHRLTDSPACIVTGNSDMSPQMIDLMKQMGQPVPDVKPVFEVNMEHELVKHIDQVQDEAQFKQWVEVLLDQATLAERGTISDPSTFVKRMNSLMLSLTK
ncbi:molecular chaperone HtpG [Psychrosphaera sp. B3R10]|uniref:molecular chaperone HtpG n=1 Tax=unclassified Psychrosphaera TaxID=2641570 RepID=UPI001C0A50B5|nr:MULTISPECIES: molecular chaperone HtpG [unclassified Psychrosphaera]MBU2881187.1 molecular chaperone HtpG [Psychrosphaera sp. I2R16]MBU2988292.1 molecular chaperone HtpG [Psychrosphaera sp. B3R10]MDO6718501.1 molecular chaperone HtpG [Psychrosphaera sp. 1_MG-2023]